MSDNPATLGVLSVPTSSNPPLFMQRCVVVLVLAILVFALANLGAAFAALAVLAVPVCVVGLAVTPAPWIAPTYGDKMLMTRAHEEEMLAKDLPLNKYRLVGTHNSCHAASVFSSVFVRHWNYAHPPLFTQLSLGVRHLEVDLWFNSTLQRWERWHECLDVLAPAHWLLAGVLCEIRDWSRANPDHFPVIVTLDIKGAYPSPFSLLTPWALGRGLRTLTSCDPFHKLQSLILQIFSQIPSGAVIDFAHSPLIAGGSRVGEHTPASGAKAVPNTDGLFTPAMLLRREKGLGAGEAGLRDVLAREGWPGVSRLKGKCLFLINLYGKCKGCVDVVDNCNVLWVRSDDDHPNCVYSEKTSPAQCTPLLQGNGLVRGLVLCSGTPSGQARASQERQAARRVERWERLGIQLLATNHPGWLGLPMVSPLHDDDDDDGDDDGAAEGEGEDGGGDEGEAREGLGGAVDDGVLGRWEGNGL